MDELTQRARKVFADDKYATELTGITIETVRRDSTICTLQLAQCHRNARGAVMGGVIFTLADFTFAIAANSGLLATTDSEEPTLEWVSSTSTIHFLNATKGDKLTATSKCIKQGRTQAVFEIDIFDEDQRHIALITTTGTRIPSSNF